MFAPEDVFKKPIPLPRGHYYPSPLNNQFIGTGVRPKTIVHEAEASDTPVTTKLPTAIGSTFHESESEKENYNVKKRTVAKDNATTSVDDLIRDIDENLSVDPDFATPKPSSKTDVGNLLSVSDNSNTSLKVLSPSSLRFYMDRFKYSEPARPSQRPNHAAALSNPQAITGTESPSSSNDITYNTLTLDSSSFLDKVVSSDDSTEWNFSSYSSDQLNLNDNINGCVPCVKVEYTAPNISAPPEKGLSFIEQLTGKSFSELTELVPKEVINPSSESEDILYQWRLKRKITEAKSYVLKDDLPSINVTKVEYSPNRSVPKGSVTEFRATASVSKEIQTDVEKRELGCQVNLKSVKISEEQPKPANVVYNKLSDFIYNQVHDSCSDISISSISTDDLTNISQLDDEEEPVEHHSCDKTVLEVSDIDMVEEPFVDLGSNHNVKHSSEDLTDMNRNLNLTPCLDPPPKDNFDTFESGETILEENNTPPEKHSAAELETIKSFPSSQVNVEELMSYLENIKISFDDDLLNVFIERYKNVLDQMAAIEDEIKRRCHED